MLRGPQGTFVGQNATGGAVFVNSNDPVIDGGYQGYVSGQVGNYSDVGLQGAVNMPHQRHARRARRGQQREPRQLLEHLRARIAARMPACAHAARRVGLLWKPSDSLSVLLKTDYNHLDMGAYPADPVNSPNDPFDITANAPLKALDQFFAHGAEDRLPVRQRRSSSARVSGYQHGNTAYRPTWTAPAPGNSTFRDSVDETIYSQEFNLISPDSGRLPGSSAPTGRRTPTLSSRASS